MKPVHNLYYFLSGCVFILRALGHVYYGDFNLLVLIESTGLIESEQSMLFYIWHIGTASLLIYAAAFFAFAYTSRPAATVMGAYLILALTTSQLFVLLASFMYIQPEALYDLLPMVVTWTAAIYLQYLGISEAQSYDWIETVKVRES